MSVEGADYATSSGRGEELVARAEPRRDELPLVFELKRIPFFGRDVHIIMQNLNGPCPLLAIANALLLRNAVQLPASCVEAGVVHTQQLLSIVAERMLDANKETKQGGLTSSPTAVPQSPTTASEQHLRTETIRQNISDAISILPKLLTGVDVNPRFSHCKAFEFTDEVAIFDLVDISLYHGWLYSPESEHALCVRDLSYNQLVERVIDWDVKEQKRKEALKAQEQREQEDKDQGKYAAPMGPASEERKEKCAQAAVGVSLSIASSGGQRGGDLIDLSSDGEGEGNERDEAKWVSCQLTVVGASGVGATSMADGAENEKEEEGGLSEYEFHVVQDFLETTSSQLTTEGLFALQTALKDREVAVFFRNNHFSTVFKYQDRINLLVTDSGYRDLPECVWERVTDTHGDNQIVGGFSSPESQGGAVLGGGQGQGQGTSPLVANQLQEETDYALALQIQQAEQLEQDQLAAQRAEHERIEEARRRQVQEQQRQRQLQQQQQQRRSQKKDKCTIM